MNTTTIPRRTATVDNQSSVLGFIADAQASAAKRFTRLASMSEVAREHDEATLYEEDIAYHGAVDTPPARPTHAAVRAAITPYPGQLHFVRKVGRQCGGISDTLIDSWGLRA